MPKVPAQRPHPIVWAVVLAVGGPSAAALVLLRRPWYRGSGPCCQGLPGVSQSLFGTSWLGYLRHSAHMRKSQFSVLGARNSLLTGYEVCV